MEVDVLRATDEPERLVCQAARGDYFDGYVGDTEYKHLMENVSWDEGDLDELIDIPDWMEADIRSHKRGDSPVSRETMVEAQTKSFIEKQLSRGHYGPWEHPSITFAVKGVSRVTMAQITRHRHMTFDIQSMRYANFSEQEIVTPKSLTDPDHFTRETGEVELSEERQAEWRRRYEVYVDNCVELYQNMVDDGVPKEDARFILPLGTTVNMTFSGNARTFLHLLDMRKKANAQWEIRELSEALLDELFEWMPYSFSHYEKHGPNKLSP